MPVLQCLLEGSICKLSVNGSVTSQSSCIVQSVEVCASEEEKLKKVCILVWHMFFLIFLGF